MLGGPWSSLGGTRPSLGRTEGPRGTPWRRLGPPKRVQSHFKIIEKPLVFIAFLNIEVIWKLSEGSWAALWGPREVLFGVDVAQREELSGYFRFLQKTEKGQWPLTPHFRRSSPSLQVRLGQPRGEGQCFASPLETEGDGWTRCNLKRPVSGGYGGYMALSHL